MAFSIPPAEAATAPSSSALVLVGKNITTAADLETWQIFNAEGTLLTTQTVPAPPDSYIETRVEPLATAEAQGDSYVPLPQSAAQFQAALVTLHGMLVQQTSADSDSTVNATPAVSCNERVSVKSYIPFSAANTHVNYSVTYNTGTVASGCGIGILNYSSNLNPSTSSSVYQCEMTW